MADPQHTKPEDCPTPIYHETHRYCPSCTWTEEGPIAAAAEGQSPPLGDAAGEFRVVKIGGSPLMDDEPLFVFRAQDMFLPDILDEYIDWCSKGGSPDAHVQAVYDLRTRVVEWQTAHPDLVKLPSVGVQQRQMRRLIRSTMVGATPVGILVLDPDVDDDSADYMLENMRQAANNGHPWPPVIVSPDAEFVVTAQPSRRYAARRLLLAIQGGPR